MPVLGMAGTGAFSADSRPKNYRQSIILLEPNTKAPLTAIMSRLKEEQTDDPEFKVFLKALPVQRALGSGAQLSTATTINLQGSGAGAIFKAGHAVLNERTLEVMWVTANPTSPYNSITVVRGKGSTAAALNDGDGLLIIGSSHQEGAAIPLAIGSDPAVTANFTQIFRDVLHLTGTAVATRMRWAEGGPTKEFQREALELHAIGMERAFFFGTGVEDTSGAQPQRTTKGILAFLTTNVTDFTAGVSIDGWENFLESVFKNGSSEKAFFCGSRALNVLNKLARAHYTINATPTSDTYGQKMTTWITPFGMLQVIQHPLFSENATFQSWGFAVDPKFLVYRYLRGRDTDYKENRQNSGDDSRKDEWLTEAGLELQHEKAHGVAKTMSAAI
jgi:Family of unknown function (DUF5309)